MRQQCRCCLTTNSNLYINIFEQHKSGTTYAENIGYLAEVQINHDDGLPQQICSNCYNEVQRIFNFSLNVRLADEKLRQELDAIKNQVADEQMENDQTIENEYFASVDVSDDMEVCVVEEILEAGNDQENLLIVEDINEEEEIHMVEEIVEPSTNSNSHKENLLHGLAQVAATQENVNINDNPLGKELAYLPEDENDEDYSIVFKESEENNFEPSKWKCGECKVILRGDVSYEGHMNIHKQIRPHICDLCQYKYRCRLALKRHKDLKHTPPPINTNCTKILYLCMDCNKNFYSEKIFYLHQAIIHNQGDKCPFECDYKNGNNIKVHVESLHGKELNSTPQNFFINESCSASFLYQCYRCSTKFDEFALLEAHFNQCYVENELLLQQDDNAIIESNNIVEIITVDDSDISVQCNICNKKLLKKNLNKHLDLHKRKDKEGKESDENKKYLCSFCHKSFQNKQLFVKHSAKYGCSSIKYKLQSCPQSKYRFKDKKLLQEHKKKVDNKLLTSCSQCKESFKDKKLLQEHEKKAHITKFKYNCKICGNYFSGRGQLSAHNRLHKERPYKCDQCDKSYPRSVDLDIHMRTHTGELPYKCHLCDKRFAIKVRLTYHLQKHEGVTHACSYCTAVYDHRSKLKAHLFKHTGMPYKCEICPGVGYERRMRFANHMSRHHQKILSEDELTKIFAKNTGKIVHFKNPEAKFET